MAAVLAEFTEAASRRSWQLGQFDCMMIAAEWVALRTGVDPAVEFRGAYWSEKSRADLLNRRGGIGFLGLMKNAARLCRLHATETPQAGDVGLVRFDLRPPSIVAAIALDDANWWTPVASGGAMVARAPLVRVIKAWRVP